MLKIISDMSAISLIYTEEYKMDIVVATNNKGKLAEIKKILSDHNVMSQGDVGAYEDVEETGTTYEENALLKAKTVRKYTDKIIIADDSGLEVDALGGEPGLYSARYAGDGTTPDQGMEKLLKNLEGVEPEKRSAHFVSCITALMPDGTVHTFTGICEGFITSEKRGNGGFGFDPIFWTPEFNKTFSEITDEEKNSISHRYKALSSLRNFLDSLNSNEN